MTVDNFVLALRMFSSRPRFRPFVVEMHTGFHFLVRHPEALILRGQLAVYIRRNYYVRLFDASSVNQLCDHPFEDEAAHPP